MALRFALLLCVLAVARADESTTPAVTTKDVKIPTDELIRVVGGRSAYPGEFPHQVSLQTGWSSQHFCGGTILSNRWILTAAHCIDGQSITVKAGKHNIGYQESTEQVSKVERTIVHERFRGEVSPYDIALLKLYKPLQYNQYVQPINLPSARVQPTGSAILSGWGSMSRTQNPTYPSILQTVTMSLLDVNNCKRAMYNVSPFSAGSVHYTNICTSPGASIKSACSGDSGGPLINSNKEIIGIVSWGLTPCGTSAPSIYTNVSDFVDWIRKQIASN